MGHEKRETLYQSNSLLRLLESSQAGQERMWRTVGLVLRCSAIGESYPTAIPLCPRIGQYDIGKAKFRSCNSSAPSPHFPSLSITFLVWQVETLTLFLNFFWRILSRK